MPFGRDICAVQWHVVLDGGSSIPDPQGGVNFSGCRHSYCSQILHLQTAAYVYEIETRSCVDWLEWLRLLPNYFSGLVVSLYCIMWEPMCLFVTCLADLWFWLGAHCWPKPRPHRLSDGVRRHKMVPCPGDYAQLKGLQQSQYPCHG